MILFLDKFTVFQFIVCILSDTIGNMSNIRKKKTISACSWALCIRRTRADADGRGHFLFIYFFFIFFCVFFWLAYIDLRGQLERDPESDRFGHPPPPTHHDLMKIY